MDFGKYDPLYRQKHNIADPAAAQPAPQQQQPAQPAPGSLTYVDALTGTAEFAPRGPRQGMPDYSHLSSGMAGLGAGVQDVKSLWGGFMAAAGQASGSEELKAYGLEVMKAGEMEGAKYREGRATKVEDIDFGDNFTEFAVFNLAMLGPFALESALSALAGAAMGTGVPGVGNVVGAGAGVLGKTVLKKALRNYVKGELQDEAEKKMAQNALRQVGASFGAMTVGYPQHVGDAYSEVLESGQENAGPAFAAAVPMAALDAVLPGLVAGKLLNPGKGSAPIRGLKGLLQGSAAEGLTEAGQEETLIRLRQSLDPEFDPYGEEANSLRLNAAVIGALGGAAAGGAGGLLSRRSDTPPLPEAGDLGLDGTPTPEGPPAAPTELRGLKGVLGDRYREPGVRPSGLKKIMANPDKARAEARDRETQRIEALQQLQAEREAAEGKNYRSLRDILGERYNEPGLRQQLTGLNAIMADPEAARARVRLSKALGIADQQLAMLQAEAKARRDSRPLSEILGDLYRTPGVRPPPPKGLKAVMARRGQIQADAEELRLAERLAAQLAEQDAQAAAEAARPKGLKAALGERWKETPTPEPAKPLTGLNRIRQDQEYMRSIAEQAREAANTVALAAAAKNEPLRGLKGVLGKRFNEGPPTGLKRAVTNPERVLANLRAAKAAELAAAGRKARRSRMPPNLVEPRLLRNPYRNELQNMANSLVKGGDVSYIRDEQGRITGRTPSVNPSWFQRLSEDKDYKMSTDQAKRAVERALKGEKLGAREARVVVAMLDDINERRDQQARDNRWRLESLRARRKYLRESMDIPGFDEADLDSMGQVYDEADYNAQLSDDERVVAEMAQQALELGVSQAEVNAAIDSTTSTDSAMAALELLIWSERNGHRAQQAQTGDVPTQQGESPTETVGTETTEETPTLAEKVEAAADQAANSPNNDLPESTIPQQEADNYKKGHVRIAGLSLSIENPRGSKRKGVSPDGKKWENTLAHHYGDIKGTIGADGDAIDVFIGENPESDKIYVVDQVKPDDTFDEHKVMLGFDSLEDAKAGYLANYDKDWQGLGNITETTLDQFKDWLEHGRHKKAYATKSTSSEGKKPASKMEQAASALNMTEREAQIQMALFYGREWTEREYKDDPELLAAALKAFDDFEQKEQEEVKQKARDDTARKAKIERNETLLQAAIARQHEAMERLKSKGIAHHGGKVEVGDEGSVKGIDAINQKRRNYAIRMMQEEIIRMQKWLEQARNGAFDVDEYLDKLGGLIGSANNTTAIGDYLFYLHKLLNYQFKKDGTLYAKRSMAKVAANKLDGFEPKHVELKNTHGNVILEGWAVAPLDATEKVKDPRAVRKAKRAKKRVEIDEDMKEIAKKLAEALNKKSMNPVFDPEIYALAGQLGAKLVQKGALKFADFADNFLEILGAYQARKAGEGIVKQVYLSVAQEQDDATFAKMDDSATVRAFDLASLQADTTQEAEVTGNERAELQTNEGVGGANQGGTSSVPGGRQRPPQREPAPGDTGDVAGAQPADVGGSDRTGQLSGTAGVRAPTTDVGNGSVTETRGDELPGQPTPGTGGNADAGTGGRDWGGIQRGDLTYKQNTKLRDLEKRLAALAQEHSYDNRNAKGKALRKAIDKADLPQPIKDALLADMAKAWKQEGDLFNQPQSEPQAEAPKPKPTKPKAPEPPTPSPASPAFNHFHIDKPEELVGGGQVARFNKNQKAIETYLELKDAGRPATPEEQAILASYTGWGSFGQELFQGTWANPKPKEKWEARDAWLRQHLGQSEWESMQRSITNSHYTDPPTVMAMWDMVKRLGFDGGRVREPSIGIGNFFGLMPRELKNRSQLDGIELDEITGGMAQMIYPDANIQIKGYQDSKTPDNFFDLIIGNWPFENTTIADRRYNKLNPFVHDYFFLKAVDQTRPGGLVVGITSKGSMDKVDSTIRMELAKKAKLVAAFRLPTGAFQEYAGTKVVTDIIILQKRPEPIAGVVGEGWVFTQEQAFGDNKLKINEYFVNNPDKVLGKMSYGHGTTRMGADLVVERPKDMKQALADAVNSLPTNIYTRSTRPLADSYIANHTDDRQNALVEKDGDFYVVLGEYMQEANEALKWRIDKPKEVAKRKDQLTRLIAMRKLYGKLIDAELKGTVTTEREQLNKAYKAFVDKYGRLNGKPNANGKVVPSWGLNYLAKLSEPFYPELAALERPTFDKKRNVTGFEPVDILSKSTMRRAMRIDDPDIADAYVLARNSNVNPSLEEIAKLAKQPIEAVRAELVDKGAVFELPGGDVVPSDLYLAGNVREKLRDAKNAVSEGMSQLQHNVDALEKVIPEDVPYYKIEAKMGATYVTPEQYTQYIGHMLGLSPEEAPRYVTTTYRQGRWKVELNTEADRRVEAHSGFGLPDVPFKRLVNAAMSNQRITIRTKDDKGNLVVDDQLTAEATSKIDEMRFKFAAWLWSDPERRVLVEREYNEVINAYADASYDGSFMRFSGMALALGESEFNLRKHQADGIWRGVATRKGLYAHEVGTGKSFTIAGIAVESRRYGLARKPLVLGHNANAASLARDIQQMYPGAKVLYVDNLDKKSIERNIRTIANDDWDAVVMPHSLIDKIGFRKETLLDLARLDIEAIMEELAEMDFNPEDAMLMSTEGSFETAKDVDAAMEEANKAMSGKRDIPPTAKELVKLRNRIIASVFKAAQRASGENAIAFEELGVDMVLVDEAHEFKKPPFATRMQMKGLQTAASGQSIWLKFITDYIRSTNNGFNVHLFTGTPITNTLVEIFHMQRYIMQEEMQAAGIDQWDGWFGAFAAEVADLELTPTGEYELQTRLAAFVNVPELRRMIGQYMDVVFGDEMPEMRPRQTQNGKTLETIETEAERMELLNGRTEGADDRPYRKVINDTADLTPEQEKAFKVLQDYARDWAEMEKPARRRAQLEGDPRSPIVTEGLAAKASLDVRLMYDSDYAGMEGKTQDHPNSKVSRVVRNVKEIYDSHPLANQVIFIDQGYSTSTERKQNTDLIIDGKPVKESVKIPVFSTVKDLVLRLQQAGIPAEQIAVVDASVKRAARKEVADRMNRGELRVVIGQSQTLGVGVNMQRNLRAMHHMDAPWMPGLLEQRNGRGWRQGNQWNTVLEHRYLTDRIDGRRWQVLAIKQRFIQMFMRSKGELRVIEGDAASDDQVDIMQTFAEAAGDPRILLREKAKSKLEGLYQKQRFHSQAIADAHSNIKEYQNKIAERQAQIDAEKRSQRPAILKAWVDSVSGKAFSFNYPALKEPITERKQVNEYAKAFAEKNVRVEAAPKLFGELGGQQIYIEHPKYSGEPLFTVSFELADGTRLGFETFLDVAMLVDRVRRSSDSDIAFHNHWIEEHKESITSLEKVTKEPFHLQDQLDAKERELKDLEDDIAHNPVAPPAWLRSGAPVDTEVFKGKQPFVVTGHRWNNDGWFVVAADAKGQMVIPYLEAKDAQGMPLYEEREFEPPVREKPDKELGEADKVPDKKLDEPDKPAQVSRLATETNPRARPELMPPVGRFSKKQATQAKPMSAAEVGVALAPRVAELGANVQVKVVDSVKNLPKAALDLLKFRGDVQNPRGFFDPVSQKLYIVADQIHSPLEARQVLEHEALGHLGVESLLGDQFTPFVRDVMRLYRSGNKIINEAATSIIRDYGGDWKNLTSEEKGAEIIAKLAERRAKGASFTRRVQQLWTRIAMAARQTLRKLGFEIGFSEYEVAWVLMRAEDRLKHREPLPITEGVGRFAAASNLDWQDRQKQLIEDVNKGMPIDRAFRKLFDVAGMVDEHGALKRPDWVPDVVVTAFENFLKFLKDTYGHATWLHPVVEVAKRGLIDRYGLDEAYKDLDAKRQALKNRLLREGERFLTLLKERQTTRDEAQVLYDMLTGQAVGTTELQELAEPIREAILSMGRMAVDLELISEEAFQRNAGAYLHRSYARYEKNVSTWATLWKAKNGKKRVKLEGSELKHRGYEIRINKAKAAALGNLINGKSVQVFRVPGNKHYKFGPVGAPPKNPAWENKGEFEIRRDKSGKPISLWRDWTKAERESMGEITDARYAIAKTYQLLAHDLATGQFYEDIAKNPDWAQDEVDPSLVVKKTGRLSSLVDDGEWVLVPDDKIAKSNAKKWGKLAGKYVRVEIWRDLNEVEMMQHVNFWRHLMRFWKLNKTARNVVVHLNNVMSNLLFADMADVRLRDIKQAFISMRDKDEFYQMAVDHQAFGNGFVENELRQALYGDLLKELEQQANNDKGFWENAIFKAAGSNEFVQKFALIGTAMDKAWHGHQLKQPKTVPFTGVQIEKLGLKPADQAMLDLYQWEDEFFRMAAYIRRMSLGDTPQAAAKYAREQFLDYDIRAPVINVLRNSVLPFVAYTYRAVPVIARSLAARPWKILKYMVVAEALNSLGYAMAPGDEDEERRSLREDIQGKTWLGIPRMIRMPVFDQHGDPTFLDVRRFIPAGDIFDTNIGHPSVPIPAPLQFGGPLMLAAEMFLNKVGFTGDEISNELTDTTSERWAKTASWAWKGIMPSAPWIPKSWYWEKINTAIDGGVDPLGRTYSVPAAIASSVGIKVQGQNVRQGFYYHELAFDRRERQLKSEQTQTERLFRRNMISADEFKESSDTLRQKLLQLNKERRKTFTGAED